MRVWTSNVVIIIESIMFLPLHQSKNYKLLWKKCNNENNCPETNIKSPSILMKDGSQVFLLDTHGAEMLIGVLDMSTDGEYGEFVATDGERIIKVENEYYKRDKVGNVTPIKIDELTIEIIEFIP